MGRTNGVVKGEMGKTILFEIASSSKRDRYTFEIFSSLLLTSLSLSLSLILLVDRSTLEELGKLPAPRFSATFLARQPLVVSPSNSRSLFVVRETLVKSSSGDVPLFKRLFIECIQRRKFA